MNRYEALDLPKASTAEGGGFIDRQVLSMQGETMHITIAKASARANERRLTVTMKRIASTIFTGLVAALCLLPHAALAQITTGTVTGRVLDSSGAVISGAHVVLISQAHGT